MAARRSTSPSMRRRTSAAIYTSWIQTTATLGLFMALLLILGIRTAMGEAAFRRLGLAHSVPALGRPARGLDLDPAQAQRIAAVPEDEGGGQGLQAAADRSLRPVVEAKIAILALLGATAGEAVVWYGGQFYALFFLTQTLKVPAVDAQIMIAIALCDRHAVLHPVRLAVGQDRPQADHAGGLRARGADLLPDLPGRSRTSPTRSWKRRSRRRR